MNKLHGRKGGLLAAQPAAAHARPLGGRLFNRRLRPSARPCNRA